MVSEVNNGRDFQTFESGFDFRIKYTDEEYEKYVGKFQPNRKKRLAYRFFKRAFDIIASFLGLIVLSPIFLIVAIAIKCDSKGPVIFKQKRIGRYGREFYCYKFRSMYTSAPKDCPTAELEKTGNYVTKVGKVLRKLSLDELPQLYCCLIGTMSFIGYRPVVLSEVELHNMRTALGVHEVRPGVSGYAQVVGRDDVYYKNKAIMDAQYVKDATLWWDLKLVFQTVGVALNRKGNHDANKEREK